MLAIIFLIATGLIIKVTVPADVWYGYDAAITKLDSKALPILNQNQITKYTNSGGFNDYAVDIDSKLWEFDCADDCLKKMSKDQRERYGIK